MFHRKKFFFSIFAVVIVMLLLSQAVVLGNSGSDQPDPQTTPSPEATSIHGRNRNPRPEPGTSISPTVFYPSRSDGMSQSSLGPLANSPAITPTHISTTLSPGESHTATIQVSTGDVPVGKGDVMFLFDRTGSMGDEIDEAKASAVQIMEDIREQLPYAWFGVGSFMDYPGYYEYPGYSANYGDAGSGDVPWELNINPTDNITDVSNAINDLWLGYGGDTPEDYTRALYEVSRVGPVGWRSNAKRVVVLFGDAPTHDLDFAGYNFGGDPGPDAVAQTDDDLDFESVVQQVANEGISVIAIDSGYTSESEATFKGMSIGYGTAPGTNGHYYNLNDTSQIPDAVVRLIREETQQLDSLSLEVTEGYEDWIQTIPPEYTGVLSNTTKIFTTTITAPAGTSPGFYPYLIQAIGDGAILGTTHIEVTVPSDTPVNDLGFRPNQDGFKFKNESSTQTWQMFEQFFGSEQVEYDNGNRIHAADVFYQEYYADVGDGGSCDGFSAASLINYENLSQPNAGVFTMPHHSPLYSQSRNDDIWEALAFAQGIQMGMEMHVHQQIKCKSLGNSPSAFYRYLKSQIQNDSPAVLGIRWKEIKLPVIGTIRGAGGHALAPYRFEEPTGDKAYVYVYDSNNPGDTARKVVFDLAKDEWKYVAKDLFGIPVPLYTFKGDDSWCSLAVKPIEMYRHQGVAWWAQEEWASAASTSMSVSTSSGSAQAFLPSGPVRLLFTDDEGRRLGWDGEDFYDEIPDASYSPIPGAAGGIYYVSPEVAYDFKAIGSGEGEAAVSLWSDGYMVRLSAMEVLTGTEISLEVSPDGDSVAISKVTSDTHVSLSANHILSDEDRAVAICDLPVRLDEEVALQFNTGGSGSEPITDTIKLSTNSPYSHTYDLSLHRAGGDGYSVFGCANLVLNADSSSSVELRDWSDLDTLTVTSDLDKDGFADESQEVSNETAIDLISLEASQTSLHTGGEQAEIVVAVRDQFGAYVPDGTFVSLSTTLGTLSTNEASTSGGLVHLILTTGGDPGTATVTAEAGDVEDSLNITIDPYTIYLPLVLCNH